MEHRKHRWGFFMNIFARKRPQNFLYFLFIAMVSLIITNGGFANDYPQRPYGGFQLPETRVCYHQEIQDGEALFIFGPYRLVGNYGSASDPYDKFEFYQSFISYLKNIEVEVNLSIAGNNDLRTRYYTDTRHRSFIVAGGPIQLYPEIPGGPWDPYRIVYRSSFAFIGSSEYFVGKKLELESIQDYVKVITQERI